MKNTMTISILAVGKIKEPFYQAAIQEFQKRLGRYVNLNIVEVYDEKTPDSAKENEQKLIKKKEAERLIKQIRKEAYVIALAIEGRMLDSVELSEKIRLLGVNGKNHIVFIIGGSLGLSDEILKQADFCLSFSKMTFPHQLMRIILLEQIYRSFRIMNHEPYHK